MIDQKNNATTPAPFPLKTPERYYFFNHPKPLNGTGFHKTVFSELTTKYSAVQNRPHKLARFWIHFMNCTRC